MIRKINSDEIPLMEEIIKNEFKSSYNNSVFSNTLVYDDISSFINYSIIYEKAEINYIYVDKSKRGLGISLKLMDAFLNDLNGVESISLEVSKENEVAINLYKKYGFEIVATRSKYYGNVDAYLMVKDMVK